MAIIDERLKNFHGVAMIQKREGALSGLQVPTPTRTHVYSKSDPPNAFKYMADLTANPPITDDLLDCSVCLHCRNPAATMRCVCRVKYCGPECQKEDYKFHRKECGGVHVVLGAKMHFVAKDVESTDYGESHAGYYLADSFAMGLKKLKPYKTPGKRDRLIDYMGSKVVWGRFQKEFMKLGRTRCHACPKNSVSAVWTGRASQYRADHKGAYHATMLFDLYCFCGDPACYQKIWERMTGLCRRMNAASEKYETGYNIDRYFYPDAQFVV